MNFDIYRGRILGSQVWVEGYLFKISESSDPFIMLKNSKGKKYRIDENTICRCVGKEYMDGEIAFEGDIFENPIIGIKMILRYGTYQAYCPVDGCYMESVGFYAEAENLPEMPIGDLSDYALKIGTIFDK